MRRRPALPKAELRVPARVLIDLSALGRPDGSWRSASGDGPMAPREVIWGKRAASACCFLPSRASTSKAVDSPPAPRPTAVFPAPGRVTPPRLDLVSGAAAGESAPA